MFSKLKQGTRYNFQSGHFIITRQELKEDELKLLGPLLESFPHASHDYWTDKFLSLDTKEIPNKLLLLAANAYHEPRGYTVLGAAADKGGVAAFQKLIDMGANLNALDVDNKLALHWAISNSKSISDKNSIEAANVVKCLLDNGAKTDITSYQNTTPLQYAESRGYKAAATMIKENHCNLNQQPSF
jgi:ankyrin repeat protein